MPGGILQLGESEDESYDAVRRRQQRHAVQYREIGDMDEDDLEGEDERHLDIE